MLQPRSPRRSPLPPLTKAEEDADSGNSSIKDSTDNHHANSSRKGEDDRDAGNVSVKLLEDEEVEIISGK